MSINKYIVNKVTTFEKKGGGGSIRTLIVGKSFIQYDTSPYPGQLLIPGFPLLMPNLWQRYTILYVPFVDGRW